MIQKRHKYIIIILVMILLINLSIEPYQKVESAAIVLEGGKALLLFLLASLGITVASQADLEGLYGQMDWDSMIMPSHIDLGKYTKQPGEPPDYDALLKALIAGGTTLAIGFSGLLDNIKEWFQGLGAIEGENTLTNSPSPYEGYIDGVHYILQLVPLVSSVSTGAMWVDLTLNDVKYEKVVSVGYDYQNYVNTECNITVTNVRKIGNQIQIDIYRTWTANGIKKAADFTIKKSIETTVPNPWLSEGIMYNLHSNSSVITNIPPTTIPQPDIGVLPGIQETITPEGDKKYIYPGTMDDLLNDMKQNTTWQDLLVSINNYQDGFSTPYTLTETQQGVEIDYGTTTEVPFPETGDEPDPENTATGLGRIIALLKSIINWLFRLWEIPKLLFEIPEGLSIDTSKLRLNNFQLKFPFSIPWDIAKAITVFSASPVDPDLTIDIDTEYLEVNHRINLSYIDLPLRFARYAASIFFILYLANKTRDLIKW